MVFEPTEFDIALRYPSRDASVVRETDIDNWSLDKDRSRSMGTSRNQVERGLSGNTEFGLVKSKWAKIPELRSSVTHGALES